MITHSVSFENHHGYIFLDTHRVVFYGIEFKDICRATQFLKTISSCDKYIPFTHKGFHGIQIQSGFVALLTDQDRPLMWVVDTIQAKIICETELKKLIYN